MAETLSQAVLESLMDSAKYSSAIEVPPAVVLWPDSRRAWGVVAAHLARTATVLTLGEYDPDLQIGPAVWIRAQLTHVDAQSLPILYLPGVSRTTVRALETCPPLLRPIAELQFRGTWWVEPGGDEWTPASFLSRSLGIRVGSDDATRESLSLALGELAKAPIERLRAAKYIDAGDLNSLLLPDPIKHMLTWMDGDGSPGEGKQWKAFTSTCKAQFALDPVKDGVLTAVTRLGERGDRWDVVWNRFAESPSSYPGILQKLEEVGKSMLVHNPPGSWPQENARAELELTEAYVAAAGLGTPADVRTSVLELDSVHGSRRDWVWGRLDKAPMAAASAHLASLAAITKTSPAAATAAELRRWYVEEGHRADDMLLRAIGAVSDGPGRVAVAAVARAIYQDWLDGTARRFQELIASEKVVADTGLELKEGECAVFVDGLRFDVGTRLRDLLQCRGVHVDLRSRIAAFPTMTSSGKPAVAPLASAPVGGTGFSTVIDGKTLDAANLRAAMIANGVGPFAESELGQPSGRGWTEAADLDALGHKVDIKIADSIDSEVAGIATRVTGLLQAGWKRVHVVTDHGWLLMPGGLPVVQLDIAKTQIRKARCAELASHAGSIDQPEFPWTWDSSIRIAIPRGIAAFENGRVYEHGGVSLQETVTPHLVAVSGVATKVSVQIEAVAWRGLRCRISGEGEVEGATVELRRQPGDASSAVAEPKEWRPDGTSLLVGDDSLIGESVSVVVLDVYGALLAQHLSVVAG